MTGDTLHNVTRKSSRVVRIGGNGAWRVNAIRDMCLQILSEVGGTRIGEQIFYLVLETGRVRHYVFKRDRLAERFGNFKVEISIHVLIKIEFSLFKQLHDCSPGKEF